MPDAARQPRWPMLALLGLLLAVAVVSCRQAAKLDFDFKHFYLDARYVWEHAALNPDFDNPDRDQRRQLPFYLPAVSVLLAPLTAFGPLPAAAIWTAMQVAGLACSVIALHRWFAERERGVRALALACALALPAIYEAAKFNQLSFVILALVLAGVGAVQRGSPLRGGALLGVAAVAKLLPALFALWLLIERRWKALAAFAISAAVLAGVPCMLAFGPRQTLIYHEQWLRYNLAGTGFVVGSDAPIREHFIDHRNQSIAQVLLRLCWPEHPYRAPFQPFALSRPMVQSIALAVAAILLAALAWFTLRSGLARGAAGWHGLAERGRADARDSHDLAGLNERPRVGAGTQNAKHKRVPCTTALAGAARSDSGVAHGHLGRDTPAVYLIAMLVLSPLVRTYYLVWALPALVLLADAAVHAPPGRSRALGRIGLALWLLGMLAWTLAVARTYGVHLIMLIGLAVAVALVELPRKGSAAAG